MKKRRNENHYRGQRTRTERNDKIKEKKTSAKTPQTTQAGKSIVQSETTTQLRRSERTNSPSHQTSVSALLKAQPGNKEAIQTSRDRPSALVNQIIKI